MQKIFQWDKEKNKKLIKERHISFEVIVAHIEEGSVVATVEGKGKFQHQKQLIVVVGNYLYIVPYVEDSEKIFLKTIIPSRKMTKRYLSEGGFHE